MSRYIDAEALEYDTEWSEYHDGFTAYSQMAIDTAPSIDIVRCKECAKWLESSGICMWDKGTSLFTKADDYCSYGVRETNTTAEEKPTPIRDYMVHGEREGE